MNSKKKWIFIVVGVIVLAVVLGIVWTINQQEKQGVTIAAVLPLTGDIASYGKRAQKGIQLALDEVNASKPQSARIAMEFQDGKGSAQESVTLMKKFCSVDRVPVVIGAAASSVSMAMAPIANQYKVVQISPISSSPELTEKGGDYFFRVCPSDAFQAVILAEWIWSRNFKNVAVLFVNNSWGISLKERFVEEFTKRGGKVAIVESLNEGDRDFRTQLTKIIASESDALYSPTYGKEGGLILKQIKELGYKKKIFGSDVWSSPELLTSAGDSAEGVYLVKPAQPKGNLYDEFKKKYVQKYNEEPDVYAAYAYDIIMILAKALDDGKTSGPDIREYFLSMPAYNGVTGMTKFDANGDTNTKTFIRQKIENAKYIDIQSGN